MATRKTKQIKTIADLKPDAQNVNKGTERGAYMVDHSITNLGAGRSILADADGVVIAGNKTLEVAAEHGLPVRVVQSDGKELIVVQRTDLRLKGKGLERTKARQMATVDNRASEVGYDPDVQILLEHYQSEDLSAYFRDDEIDVMMERLTPGGVNGAPQTADELWQGMPSYNQNDLSGIQQINVHFETRKDVEEFAKRTEQNITDKTRSIWFPYKAPENLKQFTVIDES